MRRKTQEKKKKKGSEIYHYGKVKLYEVN